MIVLTNGQHLSQRSHIKDLNDHNHNDTLLRLQETLHLRDRVSRRPIRVAKAVERKVRMTLRVRVMVKEKGSVKYVQAREQHKSGTTMKLRNRLTMMAYMMITHQKIQSRSETYARCRQMKAMMMTGHTMGKET